MVSDVSSLVAVRLQQVGLKLIIKAFSPCRQIIITHAEVPVSSSSASHPPRAGVHHMYLYGQFFR
jgi:hypothetical protein